MSSTVEVLNKVTTVRVHLVPIKVLHILATELRKYGGVVTFDTPLSGTVSHISGQACFEHDGLGVLTVVVNVDAGHFPHTLLIGGITQLIEEAAEDVLMNERRSHGRQD
jgi:hypothetical protein